MSTPRINPALEPRLLALVQQFEGGGLAGDFDGQTASWGPLQWNLGQGTLQPLLRRLVSLDARGVAAILPDLPAATRTDAQLRAYFERDVLDPKNRARVTPAAAAAFARLAQLPAAQQAFVEAARPYLARAARDAMALGFETERGLALTLDIAVQNGGVRWAHYQTYSQRLRAPTFALEWERLKALAHVVSESANAPWRADVLSRKLTIALGSTANSGLRVHGASIDLEGQYGIRYWAESGQKAAWYAA